MANRHQRLFAVYARNILVRYHPYFAIVDRIRKHAAAFQFGNQRRRGMSGFGDIKYQYVRLDSLGIDLYALNLYKTSRKQLSV
jgi:hypothetical protein